MVVGTTNDAISSGRVGIGTSSPRAPLEVRGADSGITISSAAANRPHLRLMSGTSETLRLSANAAYGAIGDGTNANRYMLFKDGNIAIGSFFSSFARRDFVEHFSRHRTLCFSRTGFSFPRIALLCYSMTGRPDDTARRRIHKGQRFSGPLHRKVWLAFLCASG